MENKILSSARRHKKDLVLALSEVLEDGEEDGASTSGDWIANVNRGELVGVSNAASMPLSRKFIT